MMAKKLAGFFAFLGVMVFMANWLYFSLLSENSGVQAMPAEKAWEIGIYLSGAFFMLGLFVATLGIALVQEVLAESRSRDMERKFRAKSTYDRVVNMAMDPSRAMAEEAAMSGEAKT